jgi:hypothetical protein
MILKYNYWQFQSVLPKKVCEDIIKFAKEKKQQKGKVGGNNKLKADLSKRDSNVVFLNEDWIYKTVLPYLNTANQNAGWNFQTDHAESSQFTIYKKGQYYNWHFDANSEPYKKRKDDVLNGKIRKLSMLTTTIWHRHSTAPLSRAPVTWCSREPSSHRVTPNRSCMLVAKSAKHSPQTSRADLWPACSAPFVNV